MQYFSDGTIDSDDDTFDTQLKDVMNLNLALLQNHRKLALRALLKWMKRQPQPDLRRRIECQRNEFNAGNERQSYSFPPSHGLVNGLDTCTDDVT